MKFNKLILQFLLVTSQLIKLCVPQNKLIKKEDAKVNLKIKLEKNINNVFLVLIVIKHRKYELNLLNNKEFVLNKLYEHSELVEIIKQKHELNQLCVILLMYFLVKKIQNFEYQWGN